MGGKTKVDILYHMCAGLSILVAREGKGKGKIYFDEIFLRRDLDGWRVLLTKLRLCRNYLFYTGVGTRGRVSSYEIHLSKDSCLVEGGNVIKVEKKSNRIARDSPNGVSSWPGKTKKEKERKSDL